MSKRSPISGLRPQPGPQERFLQSRASVAIYGGAAGSGKTTALLLEPLFHVDNPKFRGVIFRRTVPQIKLPGGLWDTSNDIYTAVNGSPNSTYLEWTFPSGAVLKLAGMELENNRFDHQGAQYAFIGWDELCHFEEAQFWYLMSRCRSVSGIAGYIRASCNPDADSFVRRFIDWWIDPDTGFPIKERSGVLRWFVRDGDILHWANTRAELVKMFGPESEPKTATFIPANVRDNKILLETDPSYLANLKALPNVERMQLLEGNWNVRPAAGSYFRREWFTTVESPPPPEEVLLRCRFWDRAATERRPGNDPDATVGLLLSKTRAGIYHIENVRRMWATPHQVEASMLSCARSDPPGTIVAFAQDPGSAGVNEAQAAARMLDGFNVRFATVTGDKETRAKAISAQAEAGNVRIVRGLWNEEFIRELEGFPVAKHDDCVDALSGAHESFPNYRTIYLV
jgi:predicted phage terminase large subunit-like protein